MDTNNTPKVLGVVRGTALPVQSSLYWFASNGTRQCERLVFEGCSDRRYHVAIARKVHFWNRFLYTPLEVVKKDGTKTIVWANTRSLEKRFSTQRNLGSALRIWNYFFGKTQKCQVTGSVASLQDSTAVSQEDKDLAQQIVQQAGKVKVDRREVDRVSATAALQMIWFAREHRLRQEGDIVRTDQSGLARTLLLAPKGNAILLTKNKTLRDPLVGKGAFARVKFALPLQLQGPKHIVHVERLAEGSLDVQQLELRDRLRGCSQVASSNIRVSQQPEGPGFLKVYETMPYYESGELWNVIFKGQNPNVRLTPAEKTTREQFKLHRWGIAKDVLTGLAQIHQSGIVHRDLKPENVFLYQDQGRVRATVGDLGLVCERDVPTLPQGTPCYQAPELAPCMMNPKQPIPYALASDVWAAGIILYAIFAEREPDYFDFEYRDLVETLKDDGFSDRLQRNIIPNILSSEQRLGVSTDTIKSLNQLILKMLHGDPEKRPTAEAVLKEYEEIMPKPTNVITEKGGV